MKEAGHWKIQTYLTQRGFAYNYSLVKILFIYHAVFPGIKFSQDFSEAGMAV